MFRNWALEFAALQGLAHRNYNLVNHQRSKRARFACQKTLPGFTTFSMSCRIYENAGQRRAALAPEAIRSPEAWATIRNETHKHVAAKRSC
jgi:hypothetical protein